MATTPIIAPDGTVADVPNEHVNDLLQKGGKIGVDMLSPDGKERATVPQEHAQDLIKKGASFAPPKGTPGMPAPPNMLAQEAARPTTGPDAPAGAAEADITQANGGNMGVLKTGTKAVIAGANWAAPVLTGGASLPVQSLVQGATNAAQTASEGGTGKQIAASGAIGAAIPPAAEAVGGLVQNLKGVAGNLVNKVFVSNALKSAAEAEPSAATLAAAGKTSGEISSSAVPRTEKALHTALNNVAADANLQAPKEMTASAKALEVSKGLQKRAQDVYQNLDELSGGNYKRFQQAIEKAEETISMRRTLDPEAVTKAEKDLATAKAGLAGLQSKLVQGGVDLKVIRLADQQYGQAKALEDFSKKVRAAEILGGQLKPTSSSILDTGLKNMKPGRLDQALGPHAVGLKQEIIEANKDVAAQQAAKLSAQREAASIRDTASKAKGEIQTIRGRQKLGAALVGGAGIEEGFRRLSGSR